LLNISVRPEKNIYSIVRFSGGEGKERGRRLTDPLLHPPTVMRGKLISFNHSPYSFRRGKKGKTDPTYFYLS